MGVRLSAVLGASSRAARPLPIVRWDQGPYDSLVRSYEQSEVSTGMMSPLAEIRRVTDRQSNLAGVPGWQFENRAC